MVTSIFGAKCAAPAKIAAKISILLETEEEKCITWVATVTATISISPVVYVTASFSQVHYTTASSSTVTASSLVATASIPVSVVGILVAKNLDFQPVSTFCLKLHVEGRTLLCMAGPQIKNMQQHYIVPNHRLRED